MGLHDDFMSNLVLHLFGAAKVHYQDACVFEECEFLWIDGSLFYRSIRWASAGPIWEDYLKAVCAKLTALLKPCSELRVIVFQIDKYGAGTIDPQPKKPTQDQRYQGAKPVPHPTVTYQPDMPVEGISDVDTFGNLDARLAFNEMVTEALREYFNELYNTHENLELAVIDGAVKNGRPGLIKIGDAHMITGADWCPHSEGDIGLAHWLPKFARFNSVVHSCDIDLQQVSLQVIRRLADGGQSPDSLPRMHLYKQVNTTVHTFDLKVYYQRVVSIIKSCLHPDDKSHPMDVWAAITASVGNDFCAPWLCSQKCRMSGKGNDGIRSEAVWTAFVRYARVVGPLFEPLPATSLHSEPWSCYKLKTHIYPMQLRVEAWQQLMYQAASAMNRCDCKSTAESIALLDSPTYVRAQLRRMAWAISYYANAALLGERFPRGTETTADNLSVHGWVYDPDGNAVSFSDNVSPNSQTVCGLAIEDAPTRSPSPVPLADDPVAAFHSLEKSF